MDIKCIILCLFSTLSHRVGALQISIIVIIIILHTQHPSLSEYSTHNTLHYQNTPHTTPLIIIILHTQHPSLSEYSTHNTLHYQNTPHTTPFIIRIIHTQHHYQNAPHTTPLIIRMLHTHPHYHYTYTHNTLIRILHTMPLSEYSTYTICHQNTPHTTPSSSEYSTDNSPCVIMYFYLIYTTPPPCHHVLLSDLHNPSSLSSCTSIWSTQPLLLVIMYKQHCPSPLSVCTVCMRVRMCVHLLHSYAWTRVYVLAFSSCFFYIHFYYW